MATSKMKVKVKKKKVNFKRIIIVILFLLVALGIVKYTINIPIKNIYILENKILTDKEIITLSKLDSYPSFIKTYFTNFKKLLKTNELVNDIEINRGLFGKIYIKVSEKKPLFFYKDKIVLSTAEQVTNKYNIDNIPYIKNNIDNIIDYFVEKYQLINSDVSQKISEIEYVPNEIDKERFLFTMTDANYVYITLSKIEKINKYNTIVSELENKKGIVYLDSGDYIEIKD